MSWIVFLVFQNHLIRVHLFIEKFSSDTTPLLRMTKGKKEKQVNDQEDQQLQIFVGSCVLNNLGVYQYDTVIDKP